MPTILRRTNAHNLNHAVRIHEPTRRGGIRKRPSPGVWRVKSVRVDGYSVFYDLEREDTGATLSGVSERYLRAAK